MASLNSDIKVTDNHLQILFEGYSSNIEQFMIETLSRLKAFEP